VILDDIVARKRLQLAEEEQAIPLARLEQAALSAPPVREFAVALREPGVSVIAEIKQASPSKGLISADFRPLDMARAYVTGGASCISVLTEQHFFRGSNAILEAVRAVIPDTCVAVAESGIHQPSDVRLLREAGCDAILVGEALMRAGDPAGTLTAFRHA
jgi:indole-3-glycerol phosphate synthase